MSGVPQQWLNPQRNGVSGTGDLDTSHRTGLNPPLLRMFAPPPPLKYTPLPEKKSYKITIKDDRISKYLEQFEEGSENPGPGEYVAKDFKNPELALQTRVNVETKQEAERAKAAKALVKHQEEQAAAKEAWDPNKDPLVEGDPFKTLFVAGLPFAATEEVIRQEFEEYGPIRRIRIVTDARSGKPRGYAFVEYDHTNDMKEAYKRADGRPILGMRCIVDVERGRTVEDWKPRRLGGGLGGLRRAAKKSGQDGLREREQDRIRERMRLRMQRQRPPRDNALPADLPVPPPDLGGAPYAPVDVPRGPPVDRRGFRDRGDDRGYDRGSGRGYDRGSGRGYDRGSDRGYDRGRDYDRRDRGRDYDRRDDRRDDRKRRDRDGYDGERGSKRYR